MIRCRDLNRTFEVEGKATKVALDGIDFAVEAGETRCLLGPNGAGKTTLVRILATVLLPSSGTATIDGLDVVADAPAVRRQVRLNLGGDGGFHRGLRVVDNVRYWATMYGLGWRQAKRETDRVLELVGMAGEHETKVDALSRGMRQRVHLARSLLGEARVLLLDEPTSGMDPVAAHSFRGTIRSLKAEGRTILLTTHNMVEAEELADSITMLNQGRDEATDTPARLRRLLADHTSIVAVDVPEPVQEGLAALEQVSDLHRDRDTVTIEVVGDSGTVLRLLVEAGVTELRSEPPTLERIYFQLFGERGVAV